MLDISLTKETDNQIIDPKKLINIYSYAFKFMYL